MVPTASRRTELTARQASSSSMLQRSVRMESCRSARGRWWRLAGWAAFVGIVVVVGGGQPPRVVVNVVMVMVVVFVDEWQAEA